MTSTEQTATPAEDVEAQAAWLDHVKQVAGRVNYRPETYRFRVEIDAADPAGRVFIQLEHDRPDAFTGEPGVGRGGKSYLSPHMTVSEIVRRMLGMALAYEEHEVREFFQYRGKRVFGPHIDVEALADVADELDIRL